MPRAVAASIHASEALAQAMFERLLLLDATLKSIPPRARSRSSASPARHPPIRPEPAPRIPNQRRSGPPSRLGGERHPDLDANRLLSTGLDLLASRRFVALEFVADDGRRTPVVRPDGGAAPVGHRRCGTISRPAFP
jgi:hypothetical protein